LAYFTSEKEYLLRSPHVDVAFAQSANQQQQKTQAGGYLLPFLPSTVANHVSLLLFKKKFRSLHTTTHMI
jgi:hypothetical protein